MRGLTGLALVLAGAVTTFFVYYPEAGDRQDAVDRALAAFSGEPPQATAQSTEMALVVVDPQRRAFSPQAPLFQQVPRGEPAPQSGSGSTAVPAPSQLAARPLSQPSDAPSSSVSTPSALNGLATSAADRRVDLAAAEPLISPAAAVAPGAQPARTSAPTAKAGSEEAQRTLARSLQKELKRVGCYDGEINGNWTAASRRAMKTFTDRVNATLPIDEPDYILLTLVQGHAAEACGARCPADQTLAKDGKCQPRAIVAQAEKNATKRRQPVAARTADLPAPKTPEVGRAIEMWAKVSPESTGSIGSRSARTDDWKATVVAAPPPPVVAAVAQPAPATTPLPGRMSIGGPGRIASTSAVASVAAVEAPAAATERASTRRIPRHVVHNERPRPSLRRARSYDGGGSAQAPRRAEVSKSSRVRNMHYNLFSRPDRTTN